jgi:hypothetical protein
MILKTNKISKQMSIEHLVKFPEILGKLETTSSQDLITVNAINQAKEMEKQTAVEWLDNELWALKLKLRGGEISLDFYFEQKIKLINQAIEMEKEQMLEYIKKNYCIGHKSLEFHRLEFEEYYNETYKIEEK